MKLLSLCAAALVGVSTSSAAFVPLDDFEDGTLGNGSINFGPGGGAPTALVSTGTGLLAGSFSLSATPTLSGTYDYFADIPFSALVNLDTSNPLIRITARFEASTAVQYVSLRLIGNNNLNGPGGGYSPLGSDIGGIDGNTVTGEVSIAALLTQMSQSTNLATAYNSVRLVINKGNSTGGVMYIDNIEYNASAIPEPSSFAALAGVGMLACAAMCRRHRA